MAKAKKKAESGKKKANKAKKAKPTLDLKTDATAITDGAMKDAFRQAFLRRDV